jgi:hypothetical protein
VTFVNKIPPQNKTGISVPLVGSVSATVYTDVSVTFFGQQKNLPVDQSAQWSFTAPATTGTITYTYRIVPQAGLAASVANQVVTAVAGGLPALPAPTPYVVQTVLPAVPNLPSVNIPQLPQVNVQLPPGGSPAPLPGGNPGDDPGPGQPSDVTDPGIEGATGTQYSYGNGATPQMSPVDTAAAAAFDPSRFFVPGTSLRGADRSGSGSGSGGLPGGYDGASVPVFGQLAGLDGSNLDEESAQQAAGPNGGTAATLPAAALAAVVALATVTAALVRTHQTRRASR